MKLHALNVTK